jgi:hypothetical protein
MTRKSKKGIVGKAMPTPSQRPEVGTGISFKDNNLATSDQIEREIKDRRK